MLKNRTCSPHVSNCLKNLNASQAQDYRSPNDCKAHSVVFVSFFLFRSLAGLCIVDKPAAGATISISGLVLTDTARFDTGQDAGMHAAPIHLIDEIGGMGGIHLTNIVVHQRPRSTRGNAMLSESPALRYDATTCGHGPPSPCPNRTALRGSTIFVRPPPASGGSTSDCGPVNAVASMDGKRSHDGSVFTAGRDVFENITLVCCTPAYIAAHPHDPQTFDGCRV